MLRPTPGDPRGAEQHHWNTGAKENLFLCILGVENIEVINGEQVVWIDSSMVSEREVNFLPFLKHSRRSEFVA